MFRYIILLFFCSLSSVLNSMNHKIYSDRIASLQVVAGNDWMGIPAIRLNGRNVINISFDDLTHDYNRYTYTIRHCEADWSVSEDLFYSDYIDGFQEGLVLEDYEESINTNTLFLHYHLTIPNRQCRIKMSGNYRLDVFDEESGDTLFTSYFMVYEPIVSVQTQILTETDIDVRRDNQQLDLTVNYPNSLFVSDARRQFKVSVIQNQRNDTQIWLPAAPVVRQGSMQWTHVKDLIFPAGNEFHKFEILDPHRNSLGVESIIWDGKWNNIHLYHDYPRRAYVYEEDANGAFYIRNSDNIDNDISSDYVMVHFYLDSEPLDGDVYVDGRWAIESFDERYKMEYDEKGKYYHVAVPLKYGYYNYQYLLQPFNTSSLSYTHSSKLSLTKFTEGDFFQTENAYYVFVYYRSDRDRTWRLVGVGGKMKE